MLINELVDCDIDNEELLVVIVGIHNVELDEVVIKRVEISVLEM